MIPGSVAERSKALVLGTSLFGGVGSNPTAAIFALLADIAKMIIVKKFTRSYYWSYLFFIFFFQKLTAWAAAWPCQELGSHRHAHDCIPLTSTTASVLPYKNPEPGTFAKSLDPLGKEIALAGFKPRNLPCQSTALFTCSF